MQSFLGFIQALLYCGTGLVVAVLVLLALPQCQLRAFLLPIVCWGLAIFCGIYCISPVDLAPEALLGPFGLVDDLGAMVAGVAAASTAMKSRRSSTLKRSE